MLLIVSFCSLSIGAKKRKREKNFYVTLFVTRCSLKKYVSLGVNTKNNINCRHIYSIRHNMIYSIMSILKICYSKLNKRHLY